MYRLVWFIRFSRQNSLIPEGCPFSYEEIVEQVIGSFNEMLEDYRTEEGHPLRYNEYKIIKYFVGCYLSYSTITLFPLVILIYYNKFSVKARNSNIGIYGDVVKIV